MKELDLAKFALFLLIGLVAKHFVADYAMQSAWIIKGKRNFLKLGGYLHAGIHAVGTILVFVVFAIPTKLLWGLVVTEFFIHYLIDFMKENIGAGISSDAKPRMFWAINGFDQLLHHLTYIVLVFVVVHNL